MRHLAVVALLAAAVALSGCDASQDASLAEVGTPSAASQVSYLQYVKATWTGELPGDDVLVAYGAAACARLIDEEPDDVTDIAGWTGPTATLADLRTVVMGAALSLCPLS